MKTAKEIAQWVINNRYTNSENEIVSNVEMYHELVESIEKLCNIPHVSNRIYTVVDQDGDLINCWKNKEDAEKHAEDLRKKHGTHFEATEEPLF